MRLSRHALLVVACALLLPRDASTQDVVRSFPWEEVAASANTALPGAVGAASPGLTGSSLHVVHTGGAATLPLLTIEQPRITAAQYAVRGRVKYDGVAAGSFLEMWNHLPGGAYFSRTLAPSGPMGRLEGTSGWRDFVLPFTNSEGGAPPTRLVVNLVMAGPGTVEVGPLELVQFSGASGIARSSNGWWSERAGSIAGALAGATLGILGAMVGWLASTGRSKRLVLGLLRTVGIAGVVALTTAGIAWTMGQTSAVYYPLLLIGGLCAVLGFSLPASVARRYEALELRRMHAMDA